MNTLSILGSDQRPSEILYYSVDADEQFQRSFSRFVPSFYELSLSLLCSPGCLSANTEQHHFSCSGGAGSSTGAVLAPP